MAHKQIFINLEPMETRAAIMEDGMLVELLVERPMTQRIAGNIYKGRVENILPGMEAAFVSLGLEKNAFLYAGDVNTDEETAVAVEGLMEPKPRKSIRELLRPRQEIMVQVVKEPQGTKGARVTTNISLPGRFLVYIPGMDYIGVSRKIENEAERNRLKEIVEAHRASGVGVIVRTVADGCSEAEIIQDLHFLERLWSRIQRREKTFNAPSLLHKDLGLSFRIVRDYITDDVTEVWIDAQVEYERMLDLCDMMSPALKGKIHYWDPRHGGLFEHKRLEQEIEKALRQKVWLKSGGYLIIDPTEALTVIDVNTGKFVGSTNLADTVLQTNVEAAREIARQLRLRDLAGIIIVDFIDMESPEDQETVLKTLEDAIYPDRSRVHILGLTQLGLLEMTRKKVGAGLDGMLFRACPACEGRGRVLSEETIAQKIRRDLKALLHNSEHEAVLIEVNPNVAALLIGTGGMNLRDLEKEVNRAIHVKGAQECRIDVMNIKAIGSKEQVERKAKPVHQGEQLVIRVDEPHISNPLDGIARIEGYVINIIQGAPYIGQKVRVEINQAFRTYAKARIIEILPH